MDSRSDPFVVRVRSSEVPHDRGEELFEVADPCFAGCDRGVVAGPLANDGPHGPIFGEEIDQVVTAGCACFGGPFLFLGFDRVEDGGRFVAGERLGESDRTVPREVVSAVTYSSLSPCRRRCACQVSRYIVSIERQRSAPSDGVEFRATFRTIPCPWTDYKKFRCETFSSPKRGRI